VSFPVYQLIAYQFPFKTVSVVLSPKLALSESGDLILATIVSFGFSNGSLANSGSNCFDDLFATKLFCLFAIIP